MTVQDTITTVQEQALGGLRAAQEQALETTQKLVDAVAPWAPDLGESRFATHLPVPTSLVEQAYDFAGEVLAANRRFATKLTELVAGIVPSLGTTPASSSAPKRPAKGRPAPKGSPSKTSKSGGSASTPAA